MTRWAVAVAAATHPRAGTTLGLRCLAQREVQDHEDDVHEGGGRLEEVVVVGGEELTELVDEGAETRAPQ